MIKKSIWKELEELDAPPPEFENWWVDHDHARAVITVKGQGKVWNGKLTAFKAWQLAEYRDEFRRRGHELAGGTGVNYAYFGWSKPYPKPRTSNPKILERHREWCKRHGRPDPAAEEMEVPEYIRNAKTFQDIKNIIGTLSAKMDMNKAIGWTAEDSASANAPKGELPF